jgi:predicted nucleic acid-binding protein
MGVILDTAVVVAAERRQFTIEKWLESLGNEMISLAAITAAELLHGCLRARDPGVRARRSAFVDALLATIPVLPYGMPEARRHAELWAELSTRGTIVEAHDMIIGATALARGFSLATLNQTEFGRIPGLRLVPIEGM